MLSVYYLLNYFIAWMHGIFMVYFATELYYSQTLSFASMRECTVDLWFILLRNGTEEAMYSSY